jgi:hypothetical protein
MTNATVNVYGEWQRFNCYGDCWFTVPGDECVSLQDDEYFYDFKQMIKAGWGLAKGAMTMYEARYMCPECFENYGHNSELPSLSE